MRLIKFILTGIAFGIFLTKSEAVSWFRIQEMFRFDSFHMYGIIGSAIVVGIVGLQLIKRHDGKDVYKNPIILNTKDKGISRYLIGGVIFGLGWALTGACPGPMFSLLGMGFMSMFIVIIGALLGTLIYGLLRNRLPH